VFPISAYRKREGADRSTTSPRYGSGARRPLSRSLQLEKRQRFGAACKNSTTLSWPITQRPQTWQYCEVRFTLKAPMCRERRVHTDPRERPHRRGPRRKVVRVRRQLRKRRALMSSSLVPPSPAPSPRAAGRAGANTLAAIGLVLALLALALDYLSLSNSLYYLGLGAVDNLIPVSASIAAVVVGHIALAQAGRFPLGRGRRGWPCPIFARPKHSVFQKPKRSCHAAPAAWHGVPRRRIGEGGQRQARCRA
jgi:hypothetical protein